MAQAIAENNRVLAGWQQLQLWGLRSLTAALLPRANHMQQRSGCGVWSHCPELRYSPTQPRTTRTGVKEALRQDLAHKGTPSPSRSRSTIYDNRVGLAGILLDRPPTHLDVRQPHDPCSKLSGEAQGVQHYEGRVSKPVQERGAHPHDAQGVERVSGGRERENEPHIPTTAGRRYMT